MNPGAQSPLKNLIITKTPIKWGKGTRKSCEMESRILKTPASPPSHDKRKKRGGGFERDTQVFMNQKKTLQIFLGKGT